MKASVGDRIVLASNQVDRAARDGRIVELRTLDGSPPYVVEWSDTGQTALVFPGPDAHVERFGPDTDPDSAARVSHVKRWRVEVDIFETGDDTSAHAVLTAEAPARLEARGAAHRRPGGKAVPEIGDEVAVARALHRLADRLLAAASDDLAAVEGHAVKIRG